MISVIGRVGAVMNVATVQNAVIVAIVMMASQMRMQRAERRKYETRAEQQPQEGN